MDLTIGLAYGHADAQDMDKATKLAESIKYAIVIVSSLPIMCLYPFMQKYFVKGLFIGSIKG